MAGEVQGARVAGPIGTSLNISVALRFQAVLGYAIVAVSG
jgi:hypothetical protein